MPEQPEHYTPQYINGASQRNPFSPGYGLGQERFSQNRPVYVIQQKSLVLAYVLWFFLGLFGIHKFYLRQPFMGAFYLVLHLLGWLLAPIFIGYIFFIFLGLLMFLDLFTMPIRVRIMNSLANQRLY